MALLRRARVTRPDRDGTCPLSVSTPPTNRSTPRSCWTPYSVAEQAGFTAAMCSDHFSPWSERQGHSAFAWSWLGAALQATGLPFGVVNAPGQRYHPAIIAQAIATLGAMYEGRFWVALGTGESSNEHITGRALAAQGAPQRAAARVRRGDPRPAGRGGGQPRRAGHGRPGPDLDPPGDPAAADRHRGQCRDGRLGRRLGRRAGHHRPAGRQAAPDDRRLPLGRRRRSAGAAGPPGYATTRAEARAIAYDQWRSNVFAPPVCWDLDSAEAFDAASEVVRLGGRASKRCSSPPTPEPTPNTWPTWPNWVSTRSTCTTSARPRTGSSRSSAARCCRSWTSGEGLSPDADHRHQRPVVEDRSHLLPRRRDLPGLERRRQRRFPRSGPAAGLSGLARRDLPVADAVLSRPRTATTATTSSTSTASTRGSAPSATWSRWSAPPGTAACG